MTRASSKDDYEDVGDEIYRLCKEKQKLQLENARRNEIKKRIADMNAFLREQPTAIEEFDKPFVRRLVEKVTVPEERLTAAFKSGGT